MRPTKELFDVWVRYRDGTITRRGIVRLMKPLRTEINGLRLRGGFSGNRSLKGTYEELYEHSDWPRTIVDEEGVETTNNASERSLRHAVIWRKLSFCTQSAAGSRFTERMLTVIETCRQQSRNSFDSLIEAIAALFHNQPSPTTTHRGVNGYKFVQLQQLVNFAICICSAYRRRFENRRKQLKS